MKICVNAGHAPNGIPDPGAIGQTGLRESDVNHDIMREAMYCLEQVGYEVLTVQEDELSRITDASNEFDADLFISIHCNAAENREAQGTETFYISEKGAKLAQSIQNRIVGRMKMVDRGIKRGDNLYVLRNTNCPAVLVECAFLSNAEDEFVLNSEAHRIGFGKMIALGVTDYVATL